MGTPGLGYQFKLGDKVAYRKDTWREGTWREGTVVEISPLSNKVLVLWARKTVTVDPRKSTLIAHIKPVDQQIK